MDRLSDSNGLTLAAWLSRETDPYVNLAMEECLFRALPAGQLRLFFCRNAPCVVIGRNQNPWLECDPDRLQARGIPLVRRSSGGGAVYHDLGNFNWAFMLPRGRHDTDRNLRRVARAVAACLPEAPLPRATTRHGLEVAGRKISGTAFLYTGRAVLHHGTLLLNSDLAQLHECLRPAVDTLATHAVHSVPAAVTNLAEHGMPPDDLTLATAITTAVAADASLAAGPAMPVKRICAAAFAGDPAFAARLDMLRSWEWLYGRTPAFTQPWPMPRRQTGEAQAVELRVEEGVITAVTSPAAAATVPAKTLAALQKRLLGTRYPPATARERRESQ